MNYEMKLQDEPFRMIKNGTKKIEMRLCDEKRSKLLVGDTITFTNMVSDEKLVVKVVSLNKYKDFTELYEHYNKVALGYNEDEEALPSDMEKYYNREDIIKYGTLAIGVEVIL